MDYLTTGSSTVPRSCEAAPGTSWKAGQSRGRIHLHSSFLEPVSAVGLFVSALKEGDLTTWGIPQGGSVDAPMTMQIFDTTGGLIESHMFATTSTVPLTDDNFIGLGSTTAIGSFTVSSPVGQFHGFAFDDVIFQPTRAVPDPGTWLLWEPGAIGLVLKKGRRTRKQQRRVPNSRMPSCE